MAKTNNIEKLVNGDVADGEVLNQIIENAGNEGGAVPYNNATQNRANGTESLGQVAYPWGNFNMSREALLQEINSTTGTVASSIALRLLRTFINLKDTPESYSGQGNKVLRVKSDETAVEFTSGSFIPNNIQAFTSSGTWTKPAGIDTVYVKVWGGGGGGGGDADDTGGGGGGYAEGLIAVSGNVTVTIGAGGAGSSTSDGVAGGTSSFAGDTTIQATGGEGGNSSNDAEGGTGSGGDINLVGTSTQESRQGGRAPFGGQGGGAGSISNKDSSDGSVPGGGGGGAVDDDGGVVGGDGADGMVIVVY